MSEKKTQTNNSVRNKNQQSKEKKVNTTARKRSRTVTGVLTIVLGGLGISKFYEGKYVQGILYLLFFWTGIPGVIATLEGMHIMTTDEDELEECETNA